MKEIKETLKLRSLFPCEHVERYAFMYEHDPVWRQTVIGCMVLHLMQDIYHFNISYVTEDYWNMSKSEQRQAIYPRENDSVDIYVKTMELQPDLLDFACPMHVISLWRFGFILRRRHSGVLQAYYTYPFTTPVWTCLCISVILGSVIFYVLSLWDQRMFGLESSFDYELLLAFSSYCQHILPLQATSYSRRWAYFSFIMCAYVVHNFYTSNLLCNLVNYKEVPLGLDGLVASDYQIGLLKDMNIDTDKETYKAKMDKNLSIVWNKLQTLQLMDIPTAVRAVMESKTALLCDYYTIYPVIRKNYDMEDVCQLRELDLYSNVKNYIFTSKNFAYKEQFKIGIFRAKEAGLLSHFFFLEKFFPFQCQNSINHYEVQFHYVIGPVTVLLVAYLVAAIILIGEIIHYRRNRVWPFVN